MKLKNVLIVVSDLGRAKDFYREMFGLSVVLDGEDNVILTEGLVLQERTVWERAVGGKVTPKSLGGELYFEEPDLEGFVERLERYGGGVELVNGIFYRASRDGASVAITANYLGLLPASHVNQAGTLSSEEDSFLMSCFIPDASCFCRNDARSAGPSP